MRYVLSVAFALIAGMSSASTPADPDADRAPDLNCEVGPLPRTYGQTEWLVYACSDARSVAIVSAEGNPAFPFYFVFYVKESGEMNLHGEGTGKKAASQAAFDEIKDFTLADIAELVKQATAVHANAGAE
jgi:hypothetical protein